MNGLTTMRPGRHFGFSLLEALVVLALVALISLGLFEGLAQVLSVKSKLGPFLDQSDSQVLAESWYRRTVQGLIPDSSGGTHVFVGGPNALSGLTLGGLESPAGTPEPITIAIEAKSFDSEALTLRAEGQAPIAIMTWTKNRSGEGAARFRYFDGDTWSDVWPIDELVWRSRQKLGKVSVKMPQMPKLVRLDAYRGTEPFSIIVAPLGPASPLPSLRDVLVLR